MNRQEYLERSCSVPYPVDEYKRYSLFLEYYLQVPTEEVRLSILSAFSKVYSLSEVKRVYLEGDTHLNKCTSISRIETIAAQVATAYGWNRMFQKVGDFDTLAGRVCVVKAIVIDYITGEKNEA